MRFGIVIAWTALMVVLGVMPGQADKRVALVVGNDRYANLPADQQLRKAVNDARAIGDVLGKLGFEVIRGENLGRQGLVDKLDELTQRLTAGDTAFFFFSGHGVALGGGNYILPSDVPNVEPGQETRLARAALGESDIVADLQDRGVRIAVVVLDACRSNPFRRQGTRTIGAERGLNERGIKRVDPASGLFSIYSAGFGQAALDRLGDNDANPNSVFTRVLLPELAKPGLDLGALAFDVREEVARLARTVGHDQRPAFYDETINGRVYLAGVPPTGPSLAGGAGQVQNDSERAWAAVQNTTSIAALETFIRRYPDGFYTDLARLRVDELKKTEIANVPPPAQPAPPPAEEGRAEQERAARTREANISLNTGREHLFKGLNKDAIAAFNDAIRLNPDVNVLAAAYVGRGLAYSSLGRLDDAIADYTEAIRGDPTYHDAYNNRGSARSRQGTYGSAIADFNEAIRLRPGYWGSRYGRGVAFAGSKDYDRAIADFEEAIRLDPGQSNLLLEQLARAKKAKNDLSREKQAPDASNRPNRR